ncbi:glyoxalase domain-containing protein 4-like [Ctenocephalides felis]|uniref:glyoxalase domain-containing protein 4-like n=1 Tax=Ctenocephalides felis TaxID=7515 RepID=UPI000E6E3E3D|nr:glyoxalase domain-containing protein 4-like [Ctenocephalides felis]XP_026476953.1 glyoxalase domain-containing protein 4-like [Ctenocephalides felis]
MISGRALHFVFKIPERRLTYKFYKDVLGMKVLRHEEFSEGCEAACNGPYANRWSKTMIGYGSEDDHFVIELTYNYGIKSYEKGNDFRGITIRSREALERAKANSWPIKEENGLKYLEAPGDYKYYILDEPQPTDADPVVKVSLSCSDLQNTVNYWNSILGLKMYEKDDAAKRAVFGFADNQAKIEFNQVNAVDRAKAYGRIAFSCPFAQQEIIDKTIRDNNQTILTPLLVLPTPGKASVRVIILADPDGHEICFVEDEGYRKLSEFDPKGEELLERYIKKD